MSNRNRWIAGITALAGLLAVAAVTLAAGKSLVISKVAAGEAAGPPGLVSYQGYLSGDDGQPLEGLVDLSFALYAESAGGSSLWSETQSNVPLAVGYFNVLMGSVNPLAPELFAESNRYLAVTVDDGTGPVTLPRQRLGSVPYALQAASAPWSGLDGMPPGFADGIDGLEVENLIIVAKSGGDFTSIQAAIDSITDAGSFNRYLVWVGPGWYTEQVTLKPYVYLQGAEEWNTIIDSPAGSASEPPDTATLTLSSSVRVRQVTVLASGNEPVSTAVLVPAGSTLVRMTDVYVRDRSTSAVTYGLFVAGDVTSMSLDRVFVGTNDGTGRNVGLFNSGNVTIKNSQVWAYNGLSSTAIVNSGDNANFTANDVMAEANSASETNIGFWNLDGAHVEFYGGSFTGRDGSSIACGVLNQGDGYISAVSLEAEGYSTSGTGYGFRNDGGSANLQGGHYQSGGEETVDSYALYNNANVVAFAPSLIVRNAWASVGGGANCAAMLNEGGGTAMVVGGELWAAVCNNQTGAINRGSGSNLEIYNALVNATGGGLYSVGIEAAADSQIYVVQSELWGDDYALDVAGSSGQLQFVFLNGDLTGDASNLGCNAISQGGTFYADSCPPEVP